MLIAANEFWYTAHMKVLVILCHPVRKSLNGHIAEVVCDSVTHAGADLVFHDLYAESLDPVLSEEEYRRKYSFDEEIQKYMEEVEAADILVFIHPDWWGQMPALLKGWIDRVFRPGIAYDYVGEEFMPKEKMPLLTEKKGLICITADSEESEIPYPLESIWQSSILGYCGIAGTVKVLHSAWSSDTVRRNAWAEEIRESVLALLSGDAG